MKKLIALIALAGILAVSGCNNGGTVNTGDPQTTTAVSTGKTVTAVAYESEQREDTTEDALKFLEQVSPLYADYIKVRRGVPLTFEATTTSGGETVFSGIYIKDKYHFAQYSKSSSGLEKTAVYMDDTAYEINHTTKTVYTFKCGKENVEDMYKSVGFEVIYAEDIMAMNYTVEVADYEGTSYNRVTIEGSTETGNGTVSASHYFDLTSGKLVYSVSGSGDNASVTKVDRLENAFDKDSIFNIPSDYTQKTEEDLIAEYRAEIEAAAAKASSASE